MIMRFFLFQNIDIIYIYHIHNKRISLLDISLWYSSTDRLIRYARTRTTNTRTLLKLGTKVFSSTKHDT